MKPKFILTKLSSGDSIYLECDNAYVVVKNLEMYCCKDCVSEAKKVIEYGYDELPLDTSDKDYLYELLASPCGAEFWLEEPEEYDFEK